MENRNPIVQSKNIEKNTVSPVSLLRQVLKRYKLEFLIDFWEFSKGRFLQIFTLLIAVCAFYISVTANYQINIKTNGISYEHRNSQSFKKNVNYIDSQLGTTKLLIGEEKPIWHYIDELVENEILGTQHTLDRVSENKLRLELMDTVKTQVNQTHPHPVKLYPSLCSTDTERENCHGFITKEEIINQGGGGLTFEVYSDETCFQNELCPQNILLGGSPGNFRAHWVVGDLVEETAQSDFRGIFRNMENKPVIHCTNAKAEFHKRWIIQVNVSRSLISTQKERVEKNRDWWDGELECGGDI